jgi:hypothetical protein
MPRSTTFRSAAQAPTRALKAAVCLPLLLSLLACGKPEAPAADAAKAASAAAGSTAGKGSKSAPKPPPVLLLAPEDIRRVETSLRATGPVISGSLQPERRAELRARPPCNRCSRTTARRCAPAT